jgi:hypothetical protein
VIVRHHRPVRLVALVLALVLLPAAPAYAHAGGLTPHNEHSVVTAIEPAGSGIAARMVDNSTTLEVRNDSTQDLVAPTGVGNATQVVPPGATARIRDARTRWPNGEWRLPISVGETRGAIVGQVELLPAPPTAAWLLLLLVVAAATALLGRLARWRAALALAVLAVAAANIAHAVGSALAVAGQSFLPMFLGASGVGLVCWPLAIGTAVAAVRKSSSTAFAAAVVGAALVVAGFPDLDSLRFAALPFAWPADLDRLLVVLTLGGGTGLSIGGFLAMRSALGTPKPA